VQATEAVRREHTRTIPIKVQGTGRGVGESCHSGRLFESLDRLLHIILDGSHLAVRRNSCRICGIVRVLAGLVPASTPVALRVGGGLDQSPLGTGVQSEELGGGLEWLLLLLLIILLIILILISLAGAGSGSTLLPWHD
jgi:hypothetical protein